MLNCSIFVTVEALVYLESQWNHLSITCTESQSNHLFILSAFGISFISVCCESQWISHLSACTKSQLNHLSLPAMNHSGSLICLPTLNHSSVYTESLCPHWVQKADASTRVDNRAIGDYLMNVRVSRQRQRPWTMTRAKYFIQPLEYNL